MTAAPEITSAHVEVLSVAAKRARMPLESDHRLLREIASNIEAQSRGELSVFDPRTHAVVLRDELEATMQEGDAAKTPEEMDLALLRWTGFAGRLLVSPNNSLATNNTPSEAPTNGR